VDLLHIAERFCIPVSEIAVNWHEIPGTVNANNVEHFVFFYALCITHIWKATDNLTFKVQVASVYVLVIKC